MYTREIILMKTNTKANKKGKKGKKPTFLPFLKGWLDEFWLVRYLFPRKDPKQFF
jgi:hypothetical protein